MSGFFFSKGKFFWQGAIRTLNNFKDILNFTNHCDTYGNRNDETITTHLFYKTWEIICATGMFKTITIAQIKIGKHSTLL